MPKFNETNKKKKKASKMKEKRVLLPFTEVEELILEQAHQRLKNATGLDLKLTNFCKTMVMNGAQKIIEMENQQLDLVNKLIGPEVKQFQKKKR